MVEAAPTPPFKVAEANLLVQYSMRGHLVLNVSALESRSGWTRAYVECCKVIPIFPVFCRRSCSA